MSIQVYGHFHNYFSFSAVSRGWCHALKRYGAAFDIWEIGTDQYAPYLRSPWSVALEEHPVGLAIGYPPIVKNWLGGHDYKICVTVCEADRIPQDWVKACNSYDIVVVPSGFCKTAFVESGVDAKKVIVAPHGVFLEAGEPDEYIEREPKRFLHVSGALSFPERKGTAKLLRAFSWLIDDPPEPYTNEDFALYCVGSENVLKVAASLGIESNVKVICPELGFPPYAMNGFLRTFDAVVQPSRGEGFGIVPLEARCQGVPSILTKATGHLAHIAPCDVAIPVGESKPMATQGNGAGSAPMVYTEHIYGGLIEFLTNEAKIEIAVKRWREQHAHEWHWTNALSDVILGIKDIAKSYRRRI